MTNSVSEEGFLSAVAELNPKKFPRAWRGFFWWVV